MRKPGKVLYPKKNRAGSFVTTRIAELKLKAADRRTGHSKSEIITHLLMKYADGVTREEMNPEGDHA